MIDMVTKLIPLIQAYPVWLQTIVAGWIVLTGIVATVVLLALLFLTPRRLEQHDSQASNPPVVNKDSKIPAGPTIEQQTKGDNSPAVAGVEGDVNIKIEQRKNAK